MVDVERRRRTTPAQLAGLKRLSARAAASQSSSATHCSPRQLSTSASLAHLGRHIVGRLRRSGIPIGHGLSANELARLEAWLGFTFPPDLSAVLAAGLPLGVGFVDWRTATAPQLQLRLSLPAASIALDVAGHRQVWSTRQWGPRPLDPAQAISIARAALRRAPVLIPLYSHYYLPGTPNLVGNPVFFVCGSRIYLAGVDLEDFFTRSDFFAAENVPPRRLPTSLGGGASDWFQESWKRLRSEASGNSYCPPLEKHYCCLEDEGNGDGKCGGGGGAAFGKEWKEEEPWKDMEAWGRSLDLLAGNNNNQGGSETGQNGHSRTASASDLVPRHIEFWSDLAERQCLVPSLSSDYRQGAKDEALILVPLSADHRQNRNHEALVPAPSYGDYCHYAIDKSLTMATLHGNRHQSGSGGDSGNRETPPLSCMSPPPPPWLRSFLKELAGVLRGGGWKEEDILDMTMTMSKSMSMSTSTTASPVSGSFDRQSLLEELVLHVNALSDVLRKGGWSSQDIAEALDVNISLQERRKRPHLSPRIEKLAQYVVEC